MYVPFQPKAPQICSRIPIVPFRVKAPMFMSQIRLYGAVLDGAVLDPVAATVAPVVNARE